MVSVPRRHSPREAAVQAEVNVRDRLLVLRAAVDDREGVDGYRVERGLLLLGDRHDGVPEREREGASNPRKESKYILHDVSRIQKGTWEP